MNRRGLTLLDVIVLMACLVILAAFLVPARHLTRTSSFSYHCAAGLRQIGQAMLLYANENNGSYPRTRYDPAARQWQQFTNPSASNPFLDDGPQTNDVTAGVFLLLRTQDITADTFLCPATAGIRVEDITARSNFDDLWQLGYSFANAYPDETAVNAGYVWTTSMPPDFAVAADLSPGEGALKLNLKSTAAQFREFGNSTNHSGDGQNVLYADGHVEFQSNPFVGIRKDNIYTFGASDGLRGGTGVVGSPVSKDDSVLLPTATSDPRDVSARNPLRLRNEILGYGLGGVAVAAVFAYAGFRFRRAGQHAAKM